MVKRFYRLLFFFIINSLLAEKSRFAEHDIFLRLNKHDLELINSDPEIFLRTIKERINLFVQKKEIDQELGSIDNFYFTLEPENFDLNSIEPTNIVGSLTNPKEKPTKIDVNKAIAIIQANNRKRDIAIKTIQNNNKNRDADIKTIKDKLELLQSKMG